MFVMDATKKWSRVQQSQVITPFPRVNKVLVLQHGIRFSALPASDKDDRIKIL
jgi:hypothetical protein